MSLPKFCPIILLLAAILSSCVNSPTQTRTPGGFAAVSVDWDYHYSDLKTLCGSADLIAMGTISKTVQIVKEQVSLYSTRSAFQIETILKGEAGKEVIVTQIGTPEMPNYDPAEDPLFKPGEKYILFLKNNPSGIYSGFGPWGRYKIIDNQVFSMNNFLFEAHYDAKGLDFNGVEINDFISQINGILDSVQLYFSDPRTQIPVDIIAFESPGKQSTSMTLSTGKHAATRVKYTLVFDGNESNDTEASLPPGLTVKIVPDSFEIAPNQTYSSTLDVGVESNLKDDKYIIGVQYTLDDGTQGTGYLTVRVRYERN
ncbi:MAG: hypothetical protein PHE50_05575 [Dehalococcoidales bacterium]|nr:hypothetical protein [Dehalococcoidales bacterium]